MDFFLSFAFHGNISFNIAIMSYENYLNELTTLTSIPFPLLNLPSRKKLDQALKFKQ